MMRGSGRTARAVILIVISLLALPSRAQASQLVPPAVGAQDVPSWYQHRPWFLADRSLCRQSYTESRRVTAERNPFFPGRYALDQAIFCAQVTYRLGKSE